RELPAWDSYSRPTFAPVTRRASSPTKSNASSNIWGTGRQRSHGWGYVPGWGRDTATRISTAVSGSVGRALGCGRPVRGEGACRGEPARSEEHTSELQSRFDLVCRLLL